MKKYFIFSDVHGNLKPLVDALESKGFEIHNDNHVLISLGDNFDRGVENLAVLGFLKYFDKINRLIMILGNHDEFLLKFLKAEDDGMFNIKYNGLGNTLRELADENANTIEKIRSSILEKYPFIIELLEKMVHSYTLGNVILTHAGYSFDQDKGWYINNFTKTPKFINHFLDNDNTYIFGHFHVDKLNKYFFNKLSNDTFRYKNFIGLDANTVLSKQVNIVVFNEQGREI